MKTHNDVKAEVHNDTGVLISLEKLVGSKIKEVQGVISKTYGSLMFQPYRIYFENGACTFFHGEFDDEMARISSVIDVEEDELLNIYNTNPYTSSEEE